ncbi:MAG: BrnA antitoxin family protein [Methylobacter sp.]|nr:BrnA antitoxin family protein [Methylobacter sp.]
MVKPLPLTNADGEVRELTAEDFKHFRPAAEVLPELFGDGLATEMLSPKKPGRPRTDTPKSVTGIRVDAEVLEAFRATGRGWQTRINDALKEWLKEHSAG